MWFKNHWQVGLSSIQPKAVAARKCFLSYLAENSFLKKWLSILKKIVFLKNN